MRTFWVPTEYFVKAASLLMLAIVLIIGPGGCVGGTRGTGGPKGVISGRVISFASRQGLEDVEVIVTQTGESARTDRFGNFSINSEIAEGSLELRLRRSGFDSRITIGDIPSGTILIEVTLEVNLTTGETTVLNSSLTVPASGGTGNNDPGEDTLEESGSINDTTDSQTGEGGSRVEPPTVETPEDVTEPETEAPTSPPTVSPPSSPPPTETPTTETPTEQTPESPSANQPPSVELRRRIIELEAGTNSLVDLADQEFFSASDSDGLIAEVSWTVNESPVSGSEVFLEHGLHKIKAQVTDEDGSSTEIESDLAVVWGMPFSTWVLLPDTVQTVRFPSTVSSGEVTIINEGVVDPAHTAYLGFSYRWSKDGNVLEDETAAELVLNAPTATEKGSYQLEVIQNGEVVRTFNYLVEEFDCQNALIVEEECKAFLRLENQFLSNSFLSILEWIKTNAPSTLETYVKNQRLVQLDESQFNAMSYPGPYRLTSSIGAFTEVESLTFFGTKLKTIPKELTQLSKLRNMFLRGNELLSLPDEIGNLKSLTHLDLRHNRLKELPSGIGGLEALDTIKLDFNNLTSLPAEIGELSAIQRIEANNNSIATLPPELGNISSLTKLELHSNQLSALPPEISQITNLEYLDLYANPLSSLPSNIGKLTNLNLLRLGNLGSSQTPIEVTQLTNLTSLTLGSETIENFPEDIDKLQNLKSLVVQAGRNSSVPGEIGNLRNLERLTIYGASLESIPREIGDLNSLTSLSLSAGKATTLPPEIGNLQNLKNLEITAPKLESIPASIGDLTNLDTLYFAIDKNLTKPLPKELLNISEKLRYFIIHYSDNLVEEERPCHSAETPELAAWLDSIYPKWDAGCN